MSRSRNRGKETAESLEALPKAALARVREEYETIADMSGLSMDQINRWREPTDQYDSMDEFLRIWWARAGAVADFAVGLGLITPDQAREILVDFCSAHPELGGDGRPAQ